MKLIFQDDLARALSVDEDAILELARTRPLPFAVSTATPRRLFIAASDLQIWQAAVQDRDEKDE